jgi:hypothetical protein
MPNPDRPQAPGYLANLMARLFHEISGEGLKPLGIAPAHFPLLIELWFGDSPITRDSLIATQESSAEEIDALVQSMTTANLIEPPNPGTPLQLTELGTSLRDQALPAARRANAAAASALSEAEMASFMEMMNRVIDALQAARGR